MTCLKVNTTVDPNPPKLVGITQGKSQPSTRFRWAQFVDDLTRYGFDVSELGSVCGAYAPASRIRRPIWLASSLVENLARTVRANQYDLRFLQRNLTATLCTWEPLLKAPFVFDVDDAIYLGPRGRSANRIAKSASLIICGNNFLANHFEKFGKVAVLPTAVDSVRFALRSASRSTHQVVGWSGSSSGFGYLYSIEPAIKIILHRYSDVRFKVVSDKLPTFKTLPPDRVIFERWTPEREVEVLHEFTVGLMPLEDTLWARGKCSFKMLTYMSVGLPVVVSPVGMNAEILAQATCGFAAKTIDEWVDAVSSLLSSSKLAMQMGQSGRQIVETCYSKKVVAPQLAKLLRSQL